MHVSEGVELDQQLTEVTTISMMAVSGSTRKPSGRLACTLAGTAPRGSHAIGVAHLGAAEGLDEDLEGQRKRSEHRPER